jgi:phosphatidylinositol transfer protein SFH5
MMIDTLRWREEFKLEEAMKETYPDVFNGFGHLYGRDKEGRPIMYFTSLRDRWLLDLTAPTGITYTVGRTILPLPSVTCSDSFGALSEFFCLYYANVDTPSVKFRWRVALMEEGIKLVDFETVDQMIQVHGTFYKCRTHGID